MKVPWKLQMLGANALVSAIFAGIAVFVIASGYHGGSGPLTPRPLGDVIGWFPVFFVVFFVISWLTRDWR